MDLQRLKQLSEAKIKAATLHFGYSVWSEHGLARIFYKPERKSDQLGTVKSTYYIMRGLERGAKLP